MIPRIENLLAKKIIGLRMSMTLADDKTRELWQSFLIRQDEIEQRVGIERYSIQQYPRDYFQNFKLSATFEKWAGVAVTSFDTVPPGMQALTIPAGAYAVFLHIGGPATGQQTFQHIFQVWLPASGYQVDHRPHFEVLGEKYKHNAPDAEEEIWIPIASA